MSTFRTKSCSVLACAVLSACATQAARGPALPFHVAVALGVDPTMAEPALEDGGQTEITLAFAPEEVSSTLVDALQDSFLEVTPLSPPPAEGAVDQEVWIREAQAAGADLIVRVVLGYHPKLHTSLNDRFWLNLPLFALGGPGTWFVADRSYYFQARLDAEVFDLTAAAAPQVRVLEADSRVLQLDRPLEESSLNFLDRASGADSWLLSLVVPSGFLAPESDVVPQELQAVIAEQLCAALARGLQERRRDLMRNLVDFYPDGVRIEAQPDGRYLTGDFVLQLGRASELGMLRYRYDEGRYHDAQWGPATLERTGGLGKSSRRYPFCIALADAGDADTIQLEVEQLDADASKRTFTYATRAESGEAR